MLITHDLGVVAAYADRIVVMYAGQPVEVGASRDIFYHPQHPYTRGLLASIPRLDADGAQELTSIAGTPPDALNPLPGCAFYPRCKYAMRICQDEAAPNKNFSESHCAACHIHDAGAAETRVKLGWRETL